MANVVLVEVVNSDVLIFPIADPSRVSGGEKACNLWEAVDRSYLSEELRRRFARVRRLQGVANLGELTQEGVAIQKGALYEWNDALRSRIEGLLRGEADEKVVGNPIVDSTRFESLDFDPSLTVIHLVRPLWKGTSADPWGPTDAEQKGLRELVERIEGFEFVKSVELPQQNPYCIILSQSVLSRPERKTSLSLAALASSFVVKENQSVLLAEIERYRRLLPSK